MRKHTVFCLLWVATVACMPTFSAAQEWLEEPVATTARSVPDSAWQSLTKPPAFAYRDKREGYKPPAPPKPYKPSALERFIYAIIRFFGTTLGLIILWGVLISAVIYGLWMAFFSGGRFSITRKKVQNAEEDPSEEDLHGTSWLRLMDEAIASGDTRLAVRYGYLHVLQALADTARINYRPGKTNADYAAELAGGPLVTDFRALSRTYEYTWYGSYPITASSFADYRARMSGVENRART